MWAILKVVLLILLVASLIFLVIVDFSLIAFKKLSEYTKANDE